MSAASEEHCRRRPTDACVEQATIAEDREANNHQFLIRRVRQIVFSVAYTKLQLSEQVPGQIVTVISVPMMIRD